MTAYVPNSRLVSGAKPAKAPDLVLVRETGRFGGLLVSGLGQAARLEATDRLIWRRVWARMPQPTQRSMPAWP